MKKVIQPVIVTSNGQVRLPDPSISVAHGHVDPVQRLTIQFPAGQTWVLVDLEVELPDSTSPTLSALAKH